MDKKPPSARRSSIALIDFVTIALAIVIFLAILGLSHLGLADPS